MSEEYVNVYRVEKRGHGPFRDYGGLMSNHLPNPWMDAGLPEMTYTELSKYRFGAPNETVLKEWIKLPHALGKAGFKVSLYKVKKNYVHSSEIQSMFIKRHAKKVIEWEIETFMKEV